MVTKAILIFLILITIVALLLAATQGYLYSFDFRKVEDERQDLERRLKATKTNNDNYKYLVRRIELASNMQIELIRTTARIGYADMSRLEKERTRVYNKLLNFNEPNLFFALLNEELNDVHAQLLSHHPSLSVSQQQLCLLVLLDAETPDIEMLLHYSPNSLPKIKNRLAKTLGIRGRNSLQNYMLSLLATPVAAKEQST